MLLKHIGFEHAEDAIITACNGLYKSSIVVKNDEENFYVIDDAMHGEIWVSLFEEASLYNKYWHVDNGIELPLNNDGSLSSDFFLRYCGKSYNKFTFKHWIDPIQKCLKMGMVRLETTGEFDEIPLNAIAINAYTVLREIEKETSIECQLTALPLKIDFYTSAEECFANNNGKGVECLIPCGTFSVKDNDDEFEESPKAIISGKVKLVEKHTNTFTDKPYLHMVMESLGVTYDLVVNAESFDMPLEDIKYVSGSFVLVAHIKCDQEERIGQNYKFEIDSTCTEKEFDERFAPYITEMRSMKYEYFILEFGKNRDDRIEFMQTTKYNDIGEPDQYRVEYGTGYEEGKRKLYALDSDEVSCEMAYEAMKAIATGNIIPGKWRDVTYEIFGKEYIESE